MTASESSHSDLFWVGALVSAWPAQALVGSFELLMMLIRTGARRAGK